jgi:N-methylhydantoinase A
MGGTLPTNTDANLVLGILSPRGLLDGRRPLDVELARTALLTVGDPLGLTAEETAAAIYAIQNAQTGDLLRKVVVEAGQDPRDFTVYAFGGAGPAHCAEYARELGVGEVVVPLGPVAAAFSAFGLCASDVSVAAELSDPSSFPCDLARVQANLDELEGQVRAKLAAQELEVDSVRIQREVDLRYSMQLMELATPVPPGKLTDDDLGLVLERFERLYVDRNGSGSGFSEAGFQAVTYRVTATASLPFDVRLPELAELPADVEGAVLEVRPVNLDARIGYEPTPVYDYRRLGEGAILQGPAVVQVPTTAVVLPRGTRATIDRLGNLVISYE